MTIQLPDHAFPADPQRCAFYAYVWSNPRMGLAERLLWRLRISSAQCEYDGEEDVTISLLCDELELPVQDWVELDGFDRLSGAEENETPFATFHLWGHERVKRSHLRLKVRQGASFLVEWDALVEGDPDFPVRASARVPFEGVLLPDLVKETGNLVRDRERALAELPRAREIVGRYLRLDHLAEPRVELTEEDRLRVVLPPRV